MPDPAHDSCDERVHSAALALEEAWRFGPPDDLRRFLPKVPTCLESVALEIVMVDRDRRRTARLPIPNYSDIFPELRHRGDLPAPMPAEPAPSVAEPDDDFTRELPRHGFEILERIGEGGMGVVHRARDLELGRDVAIKFLTVDAGNPDRVERFLGEASVTGQLQHPGIPPVYRVGRLSVGRPFLVMKLVKGSTLARLIDLGEPRDRLVSAFEGVCQALGYAHSRGVVHRDIKPQNIMVGAFGEVQLMDWGLARVLGGSEPKGVVPDDVAVDITAIEDPRGRAERTEDGFKLGTPAFMSPEQAVGARNEMDARSDVFGLGAVLCSILTGAPPYRAAGRQATVKLAALARLDDAHARLDECGADAELIALCKQCLSPAREARPADAGAVAMEVAKWRDSASARARKAELAAAEDRGRRQLRRTILVRRLSTALAMSIAIGTGLIIATYRESENAKLRLEGRIRSVSFSPDRKRVVCGLLNGSIRILNVGSTETVRSLEGHPGTGVKALLWSDGGRFIVSCADDGSARLWDAERGTRLGEIRSDRPILSLAISPDAKVIATGCRDGAVTLRRSADLVLIGELQGHDGGVFSLDYMDSRTLVSGSHDGSVRIWDTETLLPTAVLRDGGWIKPERSAQP
jgi:tRNA A-37 threonylcarbamoyl transferase component Bud32